MRSDKKKLIMLHKTLRQSGASRHLLCLLEGLDRDRFEPVIVLQRGDQFYYKDLLEKERIIFLTEKGGGVYRLVKRFIEVVKSEKPDYIQVFNRRSNWLAYLAAVFYKSPPVFGSVLGSNLKRKWILVEMFFRFQYRKVIVNSHATKKELIKRARLPAKKIEVIFQGIDVNRFHPVSRNQREELRRKYNVPLNAYVILSIGRIHKGKNLMCTLKAVQTLHEQHPDIPIRCLFVGPVQDQELNDAMKKYITEHNLFNIVFMLPPTDRSVDFYNLSDVMVLSSWSEGLPNVVLEAMACHCVSVVAESAEENNVVMDSINGYRFSTNHHEHLSKVLSDFYYLSDQEKEKLTSTARRYVEDHFTLKKMAEGFQKLYLDASKKLFQDRE